MIQPKPWAVDFVFGFTTFSRRGYLSSPVSSTETR